MPAIIGVTCQTRSSMSNYIDAIERFGGEPRLFTSRGRPIRNYRSAIPEYLGTIDGLLLPGGGDIEPHLFFQPRHPTVSFVSRSRDALELWFCQDALAADIPIFGICRGIQVMSVATRGNLYQDIDSEFPENVSRQTQIDGVDSRHKIRIQPDSLLYQIIGDSVTEVNSAHHQAVRDTGNGFVVTARTEEGVIEAMENPSKRFALGVQYHPERMLKEPELEAHAAKLFTAFIDACS